MQTIYEHTQFGKAMLVILIVPIIGFLLAISLVGNAVPVGPLLLFLAIMLGTIFIFWSLTVKVDAAQVLLYFGPGAFRKSFPVRSIRKVEAVRNTWAHGIGIHFIRGGMVYNVSGLDAVELQLENGGRYRIGTDEPDALVQAIEEARHLQR